MKKVYFVSLFLIILLSPIRSFACDICGCGVGTYYVGLLPEFNKRFVGLRYQYKSLQTHLGPNAIRTPNTADETYQSVELWGAWNLGTRFRVMGILPYNYNQRSIAGADIKGSKSGIGDVAVIGFYRLFDKMGANRANKIVAHSLWLGAGVKAPTGQYDVAEQSNTQQSSPNNFQLGTESVDFSLNAIYDIRIMDLGVNLNASYKLNTANKHDYRYGNKFSTNAIAYYKFNFDNKVRISPNAGAILEWQKKDVIDNRFDVAQSGGQSVTALAGVEINMGKVSLGGNYQIPISQNLADNRAKSGNRFLLHLSYAF